ncbi:MAG TPA: lysophospholipid acyltransferase family protein [Actinomycetota bacterium]|nr:lysophospholipid acyltransferase family protein [Actinomycetota bacterium]
MDKGSVLYRVLKVILTPILRGLYGVKRQGLETFPMEGPVIVVANHVSFLDSFWIPLSVPRRMVYLAKSDYFESRKTRWFFRALGMIPVKRDVKEKTEAALQAGIEVLEQGGVIGLYPEGTRSPDGRLYRGRTGVARLALRSGAPVVPVGLVGSREVMPKSAKFPKPWGKVRVRFGPPLNFERYAERSEDRFVLRTITDEIMYEIMSLSGQEYVDEYASREATDVVPEDFRIPIEEMLG